MCVEAATRSPSGHGGHANGRAEAYGLEARRAQPSPSGSAEFLPPLPQRGDGFTEEQLHGIFGAPARGGIRASLTSSDIILVHNAGSGCGCGRIGEGRRIIYDGECYGGKSDQMIRGTHMYFLQ